MHTPSLLDIVTQILSHVPLYVWGILAFLLVMGRKQSRTNVMTRKRLLVLPLVWVVFGAWGVQQGFGQTGTANAAMVAWGLGLAASVGVMLVSGWPGRARYQPATGDFLVPGSWLPLAMMLSIFVAKFAVGMTLGIQPALSHSLVFAIGASLSFGLFSGFFLGRSINILRRGLASASTAAVAA
ncbi:hypothetical protein SAMN05216359_101472 [Roseateles sp. YR242]|uniref:DUF6622 family protein n=1 Tax=Roseateles sp. YR242 TaxID=1855305 RepID=UPI0008AE669C|nr:DUF6622 family protein [Roseateles sp. YR242]SEK33664.1 hypothetical protein SAMN05216359_101472 [Roseateles sp. YR242]